MLEKVETKKTSDIVVWFCLQSRNLSLRVFMTRRHCQLTCYKIRVDSRKIVVRTSTLLSRLRSSRSQYLCRDWSSIQSELFAVYVLRQCASSIITRFEENVYRWECCTSVWTQKTGLSINRWTRPSSILSSPFRNSKNTTRLLTRQLHFLFLKTSKTQTAHAQT